MADARISDPVANFRFQVNCTWCKAGFSKISGIKEESEVIEYREGTDSSFLRKLQGMRKYPEMTFERGLTKEGKGLVDWRKATIQERQGYRTEVDIFVQTGPGLLLSQPARRVKLPRSWPSSLEISDLDAKSSEVSIESMTLQHEGPLDKSANPSIFT